MPANIFGCRVNHYVGPMRDRLPEIGRHSGRINDHRHTGSVGDRRDALKVEHIKARVAHQLKEEGLGALVDRRCEAVVVAGIDKARGDAELGQGMAKQVIRAAV